MKDLISINDLSRDEIEKIIELAREIEENPNKYADTLKGKSLAICFFEPSTRTRIGFSLAMQKLGGDVVEMNESKYEKDMSHPEGFKDSLRVVGDYVDCIALRHFSEELIKEIKLDSKLLNCGNGNDEHPTQTLIDLYTIWKHFGKIDELSISIVGDLKCSRTAHSLIKGLIKFNSVLIKCISQGDLNVPLSYFNEGVTETKNFEISNEDVIYMAGFMPSKNEDVERSRLSYQINNEKASLLKDGSIIMCPLPRIDEITKDVDKSKKAKYFEQSKNGLFVRMAILLYLLKPFI